MNEKKTLIGLSGAFVAAIGIWLYFKTPSSSEVAKNCLTEDSSITVPVKKSQDVFLEEKTIPQTPTVCRCQTDKSVLSALNSIKVQLSGLEPNNDLDHILDQIDARLDRIEKRPSLPLFKNSNGSFVPVNVSCENQKVAIRASRE